MSEKSDANWKKLNKILGDLGRLAIWVLIISYWFNVLLYNYSFMSLIFNNITKIIIFGNILYIIVLAIWKKSFLRIIYSFFRFYWRLLIFPLRLLFIIIRYIRKLFYFIGMLLRLPRKIEILLFAILLGSVSSVLVFNNNSIPVIYISMFIMLGCLMILWLSLHSWITDPLSFFQRIDLFIDRVWNWLVKSLLKDYIDNESRTKNNIKTSLNLLSAGYKIFNYFVEYLISNLRKPTLKSNLIKGFLVIYFFIIIFTIYGFSVEYYALQRINHDNIVGIGDSYWDHLFFSAITFATMDFGQMYPNTILSKVFVTVEVCSAIYLLIIIILIFTTITETKAETTLTTIRKNMEGRKQNVVDLLNQKFGINEQHLIESKDVDELMALTSIEPTDELTNESNNNSEEES